MPIEVGPRSFEPVRIEYRAIEVIILLQHFHALRLIGRQFQARIASTISGIEPCLNRPAAERKLISALPQLIGGEIGALFQQSSQLRLGRLDNKQWFCDEFRDVEL